MFLHSFKAVFLCCALGLALGGTTPAFAADVQAEQPQSSLRITYLVYSGRPNPSLTLTDPQLVRTLEAQLTAALAASPRAKADAVHPILGYNGILIERLDASAKDRQFVVKRDLLRVEGDAEKSATPSADSASASAVSKVVMDIETLLLTIGRDQGVLDEFALSVVQSSN